MSPDSPSKYWSGKLASFLGFKSRFLRECSWENLRVVENHNNNYYYNNLVIYSFIVSFITRKCNLFIKIIQLQLFSGKNSALTWQALNCEIHRKVQSEYQAIKQKLKINNGNSIQFVNSVKIYIAGNLKKRCLHLNKIKGGGERKQV